METETKAMPIETIALPALATAIGMSFFLLSRWAAERFVPTIGGGRQGNPRVLNLAGVSIAILVRNMRRREWPLAAIKPLASFVETLGAAGILRALKEEKHYLIAEDGQPVRLARQSTLGRDRSGSVVDVGPIFREAIAIMSPSAGEVNEQAIT